MRFPRFRTRMRTIGLLMATASPLFIIVPLAAQTTRPRLPVTSTTPRALPPGGIPKRVTAALIPGTVSAFRQSLEVSLDSVHWSTSITTSISCASGTNAACAASTPPITVYLRWALLNPPTDLAAARAHVDQYGLQHDYTEPYEVVVQGASAACDGGNRNAPKLPGFPVGITASRTNTAFPITCAWLVGAVALNPTTSDYGMAISNVVKVVVNSAP